MSATLKLTGLLLICGVGTAQAQTVCETHAKVRDHLAQKYKEIATGAGVTLSGNLIEFYESDGGKTWTITVTTPDGKTCLVGAGEDWQAKQANHDPEA